LRYPPLPSPPTSDFDDTPHHASLLLRQALALQMSPTPTAGVSVVSENHNLLNIPIQTPETLLQNGGRSRHKTKEKISEEERSGGSKPGHHRQASSTQLGLPELFARNLLDRGESLGINKTLMTAVSELRRNLPELAASLIRSPSTASTSYAAFPLVDGRPPEERPSWERRSRFETERDISGLLTTNKRLGESLGWIVDSLLQDDGDGKDPEGLKRIKNRKREALESLSYVRDVLMGSVTDIDEDRLVGEEELKDRKSKMAALSIERQNEVSVEVPRPAAPAPTPPVDSRFNVASPSFSDTPARRASQPIGDLRQPPSTPILMPNSHNTRLAPWNYTRSNFSHHTGGTNLPLAVSTLPRLPPPTSINFRPPRALTTSPSPSASDQSSHRQANHDPLGVLP